MDFMSTQKTKEKSFSYLLILITLCIDCGFECVGAERWLTCEKDGAISFLSKDFCFKKDKISQSVGSEEFKRIFLIKFPKSNTPP